MNQKPPEVTIIIPCYNRQDLITYAIDSVFAQNSIDNYELLIVDDGSTDATKAMLEERYGHDRRLKYIYKENSGVSATRNLGIQSANSELIAFLDSDDVWHPDKLSHQLMVFPSESCVGMVGGHSEYIDKDGNETGIIDTCSEELLYEDFCIFTSMPGAMSNIVVRKSVLEEVGSFRTDLSSGEGKELFMRISAKYRVLCPQFITTYIRLHDTPRHNFDFNTLAQNKLLINSTIIDKKLKRRADAFTYFRLFRVGLQHTGKRNTIAYLLKSFILWPSRIHPRISRIRQLINIIRP